MGDDLGICFGEKFMSFFDELMLQLDIIFDNAVVDYHDFPGTVPVGMRIFFCGAAVGSPARVADSVNAV